MQRGFRILFIIVLCAGCSESKSTGGSQSADGDGESRASADVASTGTDDVAKAPATDVAVSKPAEDVVSADAGRGGDVGTGELPMCSAGAGKGKEYKDLVYAQTDPRNVLDLYLPADEGPVPLIIYVHGGGWKGGSKKGASQQTLAYLQHGYAVASVEYRLSDHPWPAQIHDVKAAVRWLRGNAGQYNLDPNAFAAWGSSAGGHLVAMLGVTADVPKLEDISQGHPNIPVNIQAVVDYYGPSELLAMDDDAKANGCPENSLCHNCKGSPEDLLLDCDNGLPSCPEKCAEASPLTYVHANASPFVVVHGAKDCTVPTPQGKRFHDALYKAGVDSTWIEVANAGHNGQAVSTPTTLATIRKFLDRYLRGCQPDLSDQPAGGKYEDVDACMEGQCPSLLKTCQNTEGCMAVEECMRKCFGTNGCIQSCLKGVPKEQWQPHKKLFECAKNAGCYQLL